jgi:hypothetical protein
MSDIRWVDGIIYHAMRGQNENSRIYFDFLTECLSNLKLHNSHSLTKHFSLR